MVVVMAPEATPEDVEAIVDLVRTAGGEAFVSRGVSRTIVGLVGDVEQFGALNLRSRSGVLDVVRISVPYKLISREHHPDRSVIKVGGVPIGPDTLTVIAGPCAVETPEQTLTAARTSSTIVLTSCWVASGAITTTIGLLLARRQRKSPGPSARGSQVSRVSTQSGGRPSGCRAGSHTKTRTAHARKAA